MPLTDDEAITLATLHGAEFTNAGNEWVVSYAGMHPVERNQYQLVGRYYFKSHAQIAQAWCKYYSLDIPQT